MSAEPVLEPNFAENRVAVTRGWGDWRQIEVPLDALGFHITDFAGGTRQRLPRRTLAAYMSCEAIPEGAEFGHR
jgi:hypothetical protein